MINLARGCGFLLVAIGILLFVYAFRRDKETDVTDDKRARMTTQQRSSDSPNESKRWSLKTWTERIIGGLFVVPLLVAAITGIFAVCIKFIQICVAWIS